MISELTLELCPQGKALREDPERKEAFPEGAGDTEVGKKVAHGDPRLCGRGLNSALL